MHFVCCSHSYKTPAAVRNGLFSLFDGPFANLRDLFSSRSDDLFANPRGLVRVPAVFLQTRAVLFSSCSDGLFKAMEPAPDVLSDV